MAVLVLDLRMQGQSQLHDPFLRRMKHGNFGADCTSTYRGWEQDFKRALLSASLILISTAHAIRATKVPAV